MENFQSEHLWILGPAVIVSTSLFIFGLLWNDKFKLFLERKAGFKDFNFVMPNIYLLTCFIISPFLNYWWNMQLPIVIMMVLFVALPMIKGNIHVFFIQILTLGFIYLPILTFIFGGIKEMMVVGALVFLMVGLSVIGIIFQIYLIIKSKKMWPLLLDEAIKENEVALN